jgi:hypothetical protein
MLYTVAQRREIMDMVPLNAQAFIIWGITWFFGWGLAIWFAWWARRHHWAGVNHWTIFACICWGWLGFALDTFWQDSAP